MIAKECCLIFYALSACNENAAREVAEDPTLDLGVLCAPPVLPVERGRMFLTKNQGMMGRSTLVRYS